MQGTSSVCYVDLHYCQKSTLHTKPSLAVHSPPGRYRTRFKSPHALTQGPPKTLTPRLPLAAQKV